MQTLHCYDVPTLFFFPFYVATTSRIGKPNHICATMLMLKIATLFHMLCCLLVPELLVPIHFTLSHLGALGFGCVLLSWTLIWDFGGVPFYWVGGV